MEIWSDPPRPYVCVCVVVLSFFRQWKPHTPTGPHDTGSQVKYLADGLGPVSTQRSDYQSEFVESPRMITNEQTKINTKM